MQDRFRFRFWRKNYCGEYVPEYADLMSIDGNAKPYDNSEGGAFCAFPDNTICEQCTGLKDKNGKLIFEGDLLSTTGKNVESVIWRRDAWFRNCNDFLFTPLFLNIEDYEIIGNIHENQELLK